MTSLVKKSFALALSLSICSFLLLSPGLTAFASSTDTAVATPSADQTAAIEALKTYKGNTKTFNAYDYYINNADLQTAIGPDGDALLKHYKEYGKKEGRVAKVTDTTQNNETKTSKKTSTNIVTTSKGETMWMQKLTGNIVEINGKMPEYVETWEQSTPAGKQIKLTVRDKNYGIVCVGTGTDMSHTDYTYVYFTNLTTIGDGKVFFSVAGTNEEITASTSTPAYGTTETENGMQDTVSYYGY